MTELPDADLLFQVLTFIAPLTTALRERMNSYLIRQEFPRYYHLLEPGDTAKRIYFIRHGFARAYFVDRENHEHTTWFMGEGDIMISVYSFFSQQPAAEYIQLLEDSVLLSISWDQLMTIYADFPEFNFTGRLITQKYYIQAEERHILMRTVKPVERYQLLLKNYPRVLQKATLGQVASFLGIAQETLSRVRAKKEVLIPIKI